MPIQVTFDNSVIDSLLEPQNRGRLEAIRACVKRGAVKIYATQELIEEIVRIIESPTRARRLKSYGMLLRDLTEGRLINTPEWIVQTELRGRAEPFANQKDRRGMRAFFARLAAGKLDIPPVRTIAQDAKKRQAAATARWKDLRTEMLDKYNAASSQQRSEVRNASYEVIRQGYWDKHARNYAVRAAREAGIASPEGTADRLLANPSSFPFLCRFVNVLALLLYLYRGQGEAVDPGDQSDARQLTVVLAVDLFVTNDARLRKRAAVIGDAAKVLTAGEFLSRKWRE